MEAERVGQPGRQVNELTLIETIAGFPKEEIIPAMRDYLMVSIELAYVTIMRLWCFLVDGARTVFGLATMVLLLTVIVVIQSAENTGILSSRKQDVPILEEMEHSEEGVMSTVANGKLEAADVESEAAEGEREADEEENEVRSMRQLASRPAATTLSNLQIRTVLEQGRRLLALRSRFRAMEERQSNAERAKHVLKGSGAQLVTAGAVVPAKAQLVERRELNGLRRSKAKSEETATREVAAEKSTGQKRLTTICQETTAGAIRLALFGQKEEEEGDGYREKEWMTPEWKAKDWRPMPKYVETMSECVKPATAGARHVWSSKMVIKQNQWRRELLCLKRRNRASGESWMDIWSDACNRRSHS